MLGYCPSSCQACRVFHLTHIPRYRMLNNGHLLPSVGFGTAALGLRTADAVAEALLTGYRMFDTAEVSDRQQGSISFCNLQHAVISASQKCTLSG
jgi:hypothetical protein